MYNVDKLERQWISYRRKKFIAPLLSTITIVFAIGIFFYMKGTGVDIHKNGDVVASFNTKSSQSIKNKPLSIKRMAKLNSLETTVPSLEQTNRKIEHKVGQIIFQDTSPSQPTKIKKRKNLLIQVTERGDNDIAKDIESRFEFAKDKGDSLFLAKYYYDRMEYAKAEKWALETNKLDNALGEGWLIFAKAQAKQGKRIESLKTLKAFHDQSGSQRAKVLIDKIRRGKRF